MQCLDATISVNSLSACAQSGPASDGFGSIDYDRRASTTKDFYAMVQNRFHYAITGHTAAEIIHAGADHT